MYYLCDLFFIIISVNFIFITANHIISLKQAHLFFGLFSQKFSLRVLLRFCLSFANFSPVLLIKLLLIKKRVCYKDSKNKNIFDKIFLEIKYLINIDSQKEAQHSPL